MKDKDALIVPFNNPFDDAAQQYMESSECERQREKYTPKPFHVRYKSRFLLAKRSKYFFSAVSIATSFACIFMFVFPMFAGLSGILPDAPSWLWIGISSVLAIGFLIIWETGKHLILPDALQRWYQESKYSVLQICGILVMIGLSGFFSGNGGYTASVAFSAQADLIDIDSIDDVYAPQMAMMAEEDSVARTMTWGGKIASGGTALLINLADRKKFVEEQIANEKRQAREENRKRVEANTGDVLTWALYFALFALLCDAMLVGCFWYEEHYDYNSIITFAETGHIRLERDAVIHRTSFSKGKTNQSNQPAQEELNPNQQEKIRAEANQDVNIQTLTNPPKVNESLDDSMIRMKGVVVSRFNKGKPMTQSEIERKIQTVSARLAAMAKGESGHGTKKRQEKNLELLNDALKSLV